MKAGEFIEAVERFFLDIIGTVLPGLVMLVSLCFITGNSFINFSRLLFENGTNYEWALLLGLSYLLGHALSSLGTLVIRKVIEPVHARWKGRSAAKNSPKKKEANFRFVLPETELCEKLATDPIFKGFLKLLSLRIPSLSSEADKITNFRTWRNVALSLAPERSQLVYRFTFLSLLNLGVATACMVTAIAWCVLFIGHRFTNVIPMVDHPWFLLIIATSPLFIERYYYFNRIAFQLPFSTALAKLGSRSNDRATKAVPSLPTSPGSNGRPRRVYLAGGFLSAWQDAVKTAVPEFEYFDPRSHGLKNRAEYTTWDLEAIRQSDYIFAYLEASNPGGYALALEVGFGKALGKCIIVVDEKSTVDAHTSRYFEMVTQAADASFLSLPEGINFLRQFRAFA